MSMLGLAKAREVELKPNLKIDFLVARTGIDNIDNGNSYMVINAWHHVYDIAKKNTGVIFALQAPRTGATTQKVLRSIDGGNTWTTVTTLNVDIAAGQRYTHIYASPDSGYFVLLKASNWSTIPTHVVETYTPTFTLRGTLDIGYRTWLSASHNIDSRWVSGVGTVIMFSEYGINDASPVPYRVWKTTDLGQTWTAVLELTGGESGTRDIRHFHTCQIDPHTGHWWVSAGDSDEHSKIWCTEDVGATWTLKASGSQQYRCTGFLFEPDAVYWGMDTPASTVQTKLFKADKSTFTAEEIGRQVDNQAIYMLTRTWFPAGFLVFPVSELSSTKTGRNVIQFYDFSRKKLISVAEIPWLNANPDQSIGFPVASRYQCVHSGVILVSEFGLRIPYAPTTNVNVVTSQLRMQMSV